MAGYLQKEILNIKKEILSLGAMVEDRFEKAMSAIKQEDLVLAQNIIDTDYQVDEREIEVEEECLKILALYQPVATDLQFIVAVIKINNDLERIADYAVNIAKRFKISAQETNRFRYDYTQMAEQTGEMLRLSLDALVRMDVDMAYDVRDMDAQVNRMRNEAYPIFSNENE